MARFETWFTQDLKKSIPVRHLSQIFNEDSQANVIGVQLYDDGVALTSISGSVTGYFLLADGTTTSISGTKSGGKASVVIPPAAYKVTGPITITVRIIDGSNITTVCACVGLVMLTKTPVATPAGSTVADWSAQISAQLAACQAAADAVGATVAVPFNEAVANDAGTYITSGGHMYYLPDGHTADVSLANTTKVETNCGNELTSLKSAINFRTSIDEYFYKADTYMKDGVETSLSGYNLYKIPVSANDLVYVGSDGANAFWGSLTPYYAVSVKKTDNSFARVSSATGDWIFNGTQKAALIIVPSDVVEIYVCVYSQVSAVFAINEPFEDFTHNSGKTGDIPYIVTDKNAFKTYFYMRYANGLFDVLADPTYTLKIKTGDRLIFSGLETGYNHYGVFKADGDTDVVKITTAAYIAQSNGTVCICSKAGTTNYTIYISKSAYNASGINASTEGKKVAFVAGVIRNSGNGWEYINDSGHNPMNLSSVTVNQNGQIVINYGFTASKVLSLVATPDETFARSYIIGGSVGLDSTLFNVYSLPINYGGLTTVANNAVTVTNSNFTSGSFNTSTGEIKLSHPSLSALSAKEKFNISAICSSASYDVIIGSQGNDYISLYLKDSSGTILKDTVGIRINIIATRQVNSVFVNADDIVSTGGNFWIYGVMEI